MKCKICGYTINDGDTKCPGCDNDLAYLKKRNYIINEEVVDSKKEAIKLNLVFMLPILILIILVSLYLLWISKNIPGVTNNIINNVVSNMRDEVKTLNISYNDINLHTYKDMGLDSFYDAEAYYIYDETNLYRYDKDNYIESIDNIDVNLIMINNYLYNEGEIKKVFNFIKDNISLSKYKIKYTEVFYNDHNLLSIKLTYNINNVSDIINVLKDNYVSSLAKIWNISEEDALTKLDTYNKNIKLNIYTDILTRHVYKIEIDMGSTLELDIINNKISSIKYMDNDKTITFKDNFVKFNTNDTLDTYEYNYSEYRNDLTN